MVFTDEEPDAVGLELELADLRRENDRLTRELGQALEALDVREQDVLVLAGQLQQAEQQRDQGCYQRWFPEANGWLQYRFIAKIRAMNLDVASVMGVPYSGCEMCDEIVVMGPSSAQDISFAWSTHVKGPVHQNGGVAEPEKQADMTPPDEFYDETPRTPTISTDVMVGQYPAMFWDWIGGGSDG